MTVDSLKYVIRIDSNESSPSRFQKEAWCMTEAEKLGVLGPQMIGVGMMEGHPYMLLSYIEGKHGEDVEKEAHIHVWGKLGEYARKIHSIKASGYGERMTAPGKFDGSWQEYLDYNISSLSLNDKLLTSGFITSDQSEILKTNFLKLKEDNFDFGLIHHDLSLKNTIVAPNGDVYLLDWGSAEVNVIPHIDVGEIFRSSLAEDSAELEIFLKSYGMTKEEFEKIKPDIIRLRLLTCTDKVRWTLDRKPELVNQKVKELQDVLKKISI